MELHKYGRWYPGVVLKVSASRAVSGGESVLVRFRTRPDAAWKERCVPADRVRLPVGCELRAACAGSSASCSTTISMIAWYHSPWYSGGIMAKDPRPNCETCGQPCSNWNHDDYTGRHMDLRECFQALGQRIAELEKRAERAAERDLT